MSASGTSRQLVATLNSVAIGGTADIMRADWLVQVRVHSISCESERARSKEAQPKRGCWCIGNFAGCSLFNRVPSCSPPLCCRGGLVSTIGIFALGDRATSPSC
jgi:hypothetical protein